MLSRLRPHEFAGSFTAIDYKRLFDRGIRGLIFDIDNTLEGYEASVPSGDTAAFLFSLIERGFKICLLSNNNEKRVVNFNSVLNFPAVHKSGKPGKKAIYRAVELMDIPLSAAAIIGDQIFTDILCGRRCGIYTALVAPVTGTDPLQVRLKRIPERLLVKYFTKRL